MDYICCSMFCELSNMPFLLPHSDSTACVFLICVSLPHNKRGEKIFTLQILAFTRKSSINVGVLSIAVFMYPRATDGCPVLSQCCAKQYWTQSNVVGGSSFPSSLKSGGVGEERKQAQSLEILVTDQPPQSGSIFINKGSSSNHVIYASSQATSSNPIKSLEGTTLSALYHYSSQHNALHSNNFIQLTWQMNEIKAITNYLKRKLRGGRGRGGFGGRGHDKLYQSYEYTDQDVMYEGK